MFYDDDNSSKIVHLLAEALILFPQHHKGRQEENRSHFCDIAPCGSMGCDMCPLNDRDSLERYRQHLLGEKADG